MLDLSLFIFDKKNCKKIRILQVIRNVLTALCILVFVGLLAYAYYLDTQKSLSEFNLYYFIAYPLFILGVQGYGLFFDYKLQDMRNEDIPSNVDKVIKNAFASVNQKYDKIYKLGLRGNIILSFIVVTGYILAKIAVNLGDDVVVILGACLFFCILIGVFILDKARYRRFKRAIADETKLIKDFRKTQDILTYSKVL